MSEWYINDDDEVVGPFSAPELRKLAATNVITNDTLLCKSGSEEWISASSLNGLFPVTEVVFAELEQHRIEQPRTGDFRCPNPECHCKLRVPKNPGVVGKRMRCNKCRSLIRVSFENGFNAELVVSESPTRSVALPPKTEAAHDSIVSVTNSARNTFSKVAPTSMAMNVARARNFTCRFLVAVKPRIAIVIAAVAFLVASLVGFGLARRAHQSDDDSVLAALGRAAAPLLGNNDLEILGNSLTCEARIEIQIFHGIATRPQSKRIDACSCAALSLSQLTSPDMQASGKELVAFFQSSLARDARLAQNQLIPVGPTLEKIARANPLEELADHFALSSNIGVLYTIKQFDVSLRHAQWNAWHKFLAGKGAIDNESLSPIGATIESVSRSPSFEGHSLYKLTPFIDVDVLRLTNNSDVTLRDVFVAITPDSLLQEPYSPLPLVFYQRLWKPHQSFDLEDELYIEQYDGGGLRGVKLLDRRSEIAKVCRSIKMTSFWNSEKWSCDQRVEFPDWMARSFEHTARTAKRLEWENPSKARAYQFAAYTAEEMAKARGVILEEKNKPPSERHVLTLGGKTRVELVPAPPPLLPGIENVPDYNPQEDKTFPFKQWSQNMLERPLIAPDVDHLRFIPAMNTNLWGFYFNPANTVQDAKSKPGWFVLTANGPTNFDFRIDRNRVAPRIQRRVKGRFTADTAFAVRPQAIGDLAGVFVSNDFDNYLMAGVRSAGDGTGNRLFVEMRRDGELEPGCSRSIPCESDLLTIRIEHDSAGISILYRYNGSEGLTHLAHCAGSLRNNELEFGVFVSGGGSSKSLSVEIDSIRVEAK